MYDYRKVKIHKSSFFHSTIHICKYTAVTRGGTVGRGISIHWPDWGSAIYSQPSNILPTCRRGCFFRDYSTGVYVSSHPSSSRFFKRSIGTTYFLHFYRRHRLVQVDPGIGAKWLNKINSYREYIHIVYSIQSRDGEIEKRNIDKRSLVVR